MIELKRTSSGYWWLILPFFTAFAVVSTYLALAAHHFAPEINIQFAYATWLAPIISFALWIFLAWYVYRLIVPIQFLTCITEDLVEFRDSSRPEEMVVLRKSEIHRFFIRPARWWSPNGPDPVLFESHDGSKTKISLNFVCDDNVKDYFDAIKLKWGADFIPEPAPPGWLSTELRFWPRKTPNGSE